MFKIDSPFMNFLGRVADIMILNFAFILFSLPLFTIGASFSAAYYVAFKMVKNEENYIIRTFVKAFKENFRQSTVIWLLTLLVAAVIYADYRIILYSGISFSRIIRIAMISVTIILAMGSVYVFPLQARFSNTIKNTIKNGFLMSLSHLPTTLILIVIYALPVVVLYFLPQALPIVIMLGCGLVIYGKSVLLVKVFAKYENDVMVSKDEENADTDPDSGIFAQSDMMEQNMKEQDKEARK